MTIFVNEQTRQLFTPGVRRKAGIKTGDELEVKVSGGIITLLPKRHAMDAEYTPAQRRVVDTHIAQGLEDVKRGRVHGPFESHPEFIASLHKEAKKLSAKKVKRPVR
jgi:bifunctional DNA-binding transcriptional regulator/antitoxin component of YhaV-PrlF toxin-antitoxin module